MDFCFCIRKNELFSMCFFQPSTNGENISSNAVDTTASSHSRVEAIDPQDRDTTQRHHHHPTNEQRLTNSQHEEIFKYGSINFLIVDIL